MMESDVKYAAIISRAAVWRPSIIAEAIDHRSAAKRENAAENRGSSWLAASNIQRAGGGGTMNITINHLEELAEARQEATSRPSWPVSAEIALVLVAGDGEAATVLSMPENESKRVTQSIRIMAENG